MDFALNPTTNELLAGALPNRQSFVASGTWTNLSGYPAETLLLVECWGAGGGGSTGGSGGGSGAGGVSVHGGFGRTAGVNTATAPGGGGGRGQPGARGEVRVTVIV
jgi:hypothetical protein